MFIGKSVSLSTVWYSFGTTNEHYNWLYWCATEIYLDQFPKALVTKKIIL
jgi:hypothetical protein